MKNLIFAAGMTLTLILTCNASAAEKKEFIAAVDKDGIQRVEMVGGDFFYTPAIITLKVNVPVEIKIKKEPGIVPHNIVIKEPSAGIAFNEPLSTEPKVIRFTPVKTGEYPFYCDKKPPLLKSHKDKGMAGIFRVTDR